MKRKLTIVLSLILIVSTISSIVLFSKAASDKKNVDVVEGWYEDLYTMYDKFYNQYLYYNDRPYDEQAIKLDIPDDITIACAAYGCWGTNYTDYKEYEVAFKKAYDDYKEAEKKMNTKNTFGVLFLIISIGCVIAIIVIRNKVSSENQ